jgi:hypothetical protein
MCLSTALKCQQPLGKSANRVWPVGPGWNAIRARA